MTDHIFDMMSYGAKCDGASPVEDTKAWKQISSICKTLPPVDTKTILFPSGKKAVMRRDVAYAYAMNVDFSRPRITSTDPAQHALIANEVVNHGTKSASLMNVGKRTGQIEDFVLADIDVDGGLNDGFNAGEQSHIMSVAGVKGFTVQRVNGVGIRSDLMKLIGSFNGTTGDWVEDLLVEDTVVQDTRRSFVAMQGAVRNGLFRRNKSRSITDAHVDFEPTGTRVGPMNLTFEDWEMSDGKYSAANGTFISCGGPHSGGDDPLSEDLARNIIFRRMTGPNGEVLHGGMNIRHVNGVVLEDCLFGEGMQKAGLSLAGSVFNLVVRRSMLRGIIGLHATQSTGWVHQAMFEDCDIRGWHSPVRLGAECGIKFARGTYGRCGTTLADPALKYPSFVAGLGPTSKAYFVVENQAANFYATGPELVQPSILSDPVTAFDTLLTARNIRVDARVDGIRVESNPIPGIALVLVEPAFVNRVTYQVVEPSDPCQVWWDGMIPLRRLNNLVDWCLFNQPDADASGLGVTAEKSFSALDAVELELVRVVFDAQ